MRLAELPGRRQEVQAALASGAEGIVAPATEADAKSLLAYLGSPDGAQLLRQLNSPELAAKPVLTLDEAGHRLVLEALKSLPATASIAAPTPLTASKPVGPPAPAVAHPFGPGATLAIGTTGGALVGAGVAQILNMLRHVDPTGVGSALFAVAGAAVGGGTGMLVAAKLISGG